MITKIGIELENKNIRKNSVINNKVDSSNLSVQSNHNQFNSPKGINMSYFVPFTAKQEEKSKYNDLYYLTDTPTKNLIAGLQASAKKTGYDEITTLHVIGKGLTEALEYIEKLDKGTIDYELEEDPAMVSHLSQTVSPVLFSDKQNRQKIKPILEGYLCFSIEILDELKKYRNDANKSIKEENIKFSQDLTDSTYSYFTQLDKDEGGNVVTSDVIMSGAVSSKDDDTKNFMDSLVFELDKVIMLNSKPKRERKSFSAYNEKVSNIVNNLNLGTNVYVTYNEETENPQSFIDTLHNALDKNSKERKTKVIELTSLADTDFIVNVINSCQKNPKHNYVVILDTSTVSFVQYATSLIIYNPQLQKILENQPSNIKFVFYDTKQNFDKYSQFNQQTGAFSNFYETSIPALSTKQMIQAFKENKNLMKNIDKPFTQSAITKAVEASARLEGKFPKKTQNLMKQIVGYYINKDKITEDDVVNYVNVASHIFKKNNNENSVDVVFDTGKRLVNLVGKENTLKEAQSLVKQIKSNQMGTKGVVIYSQDGAPGAGRRFTAKAIAGETGIPYMEVDATDFGTKEVGLFDAELSPEAAVKKLFSIVKTQAEANSDKSALLFIDKFEYFSIGGEMGSLYHQKAMSQLLKEMEKANDSGLNILVVGSVSSPKLIGETAMKSAMFNDSIEVSSPSYSKDARVKILTEKIKESSIKLDVKNSKEKDNLINFVADVTKGFPYIYLTKIVKKAQTVAAERGHDKLTKGDFIEAYLQITTGRTNREHIEPFEQNIVTSHECGHATNLEVMNSLSKSKGKPWHIPNKVNFVTLDPRGFYGGAVYPGSDINSEYSFEYLFSDIVCDYGGNSAESAFYSMDGSYGISADLENAKSCANLMVKVMGLGKNTGVMAITDEDDLSENMKQKIENDKEVILHNAKLCSDMITGVYADFNKEFTAKYARLVGTGDCMIDGQTFRDSLNAWKKKQSPEKKKEIEQCDKMLLEIIECTKKGIKLEYYKEN